MQKLRNELFNLDIYFVKETNKRFGFYSFQLEINKDLTFIVIIINIGWYEKKNIVIICFGHIA